jgi:osomolarity two-component system sensor histidine kinase TcsA
MTAYALKGDRELCLEKGMDDYIAKPVNRNILIRVLLKWLLKETDCRDSTEPAYEQSSSRRLVPTSRV